MAQGHYVNEYRKNAINGASPLQLVIMLYDGALKFMDAGRHAMVTGNRYAQNENLQKAQRIVSELTSCLDMEKGGEIAQNLFSLYSYVYDQLVRANIEDDTDCIDQSLKVLTNLRESWAQIDSNTRSERVIEEQAA